MKTATFVLAAIALALILPREAVSATKTYAFRTGELLTQPDPFKQSILDQAFYPQLAPEDWYAELVIEVDCGTQGCANRTIDFYYSPYLTDYLEYEVRSIKGFTDSIFLGGFIQTDTNGNVSGWQMTGTEAIGVGDWVVSSASASWRWGNHVLLAWGSSRDEYCVQKYGYPPSDQYAGYFFDTSASTCWNGETAPPEFDSLEYAPGTWVSLPQSCDDFGTSPFDAGASPDCGPLPVPLPASLPLLLAGVAGLAWVSRNREGWRIRQFPGGQT